MICRLHPLFPRKNFEAAIALSVAVAAGSVVAPAIAYAVDFLQLRQKN